jgi:bile acid:Na+ symporter, BASS family
MQSTVLLSVLFVMVYAVSLDLKLADFQYVARQPKAVGIGLLAQFVLLPWATLAVTLLLDLPASVEAAMLLVACCPGGALSNVITHLGRGNLALSLSISAVSNVMALLLTPINFTQLVALNPNTANWVRSISLDPRDLIVSLLILLALPMTAALLTRQFLPRLADKVKKPLENLALLALLVFIIGALAGQWAIFVKELGRTLPIVIAHNALGLGLGFLASTLSGLSRYDAKAVIIESGMQNSALALGIIATQFNADLAMVAVAGLWGIWHIVSGGVLAIFWRKQISPSSSQPSSQSSSIPKP